MQLQFNKSSLRCLETVLQQVQRGEVTQEVRLSEGMPDIGRVLTTWGQVMIRSKQWQGDSIQVTGGVMMWSLYVPEDGTEPRCVDSWIPFQLNWTVAEAKKEGPMTVLPLLTLADSRSISSRKLLLRAGVSVLVHAMSPAEAEIYTPAEMPEDVQLLKRKYPVTVPVEGGEKTFLVDEESALPEMGVQPQKLLSLTVRPDITEKRVMSDKVVFKGNLAVHAVCRYDDGEVRASDLTVPFSQLSELDNVYSSEAQTDIHMAVTSLEADMDHSGSIHIKCGLVAQYVVDERHTLELVQDAYSPVRDVLPEETALQLPALLDERTEYVQAEQSVPNQNGRVVEARFLPDFPGKRKTGSAVDLELTGRFQMLSYNEEGALQGTAARWEGNMQLCADCSCDPSVTVNPSGKVLTTTAMEDTSMSTQLQLSIRTATAEQLPMVTALELGQVREADPQRPSVIIMNGAGEELWNIAKQSNSTVSAIRTANGLEEDRAPDRMILIPVL